MLPFKNRLTKKRDFETVFQGGRGIGVGPVFLKFKENNTDNSRFGVAVGVKFSKKAVVRNAIKRQIREILKEKVALFKKGFDVIVVPQKVKENTKFNQAKWASSLEEAAQKAELLINIKKN